MILYENRINNIYIQPRKSLTCLPHLHHDIEFFHLIEGETEVSVDGKTFTARSGDTVMVFPNQIHEFNDKEKIKAYIAIVSPDIFPEYSSVFRNCKMKETVLSVNDREELLHNFSMAEMVFSGREETPYYSERAIGYLTVVLSMILGSGELIEENEADLSSLKKILYYCDLHYSEPLSLSVLEKKLGFNRYYISHVFYDKVGIGFSDYVNLLRINAAKSRLRHSDALITDIALDSGYSSIRTFNRQFISLVGMTPNEYREKHISDITKKEPRN